MHGAGAQRARDATICPSEAARAVGGDDWRELMEPARAAARRLVEHGEVEITQKGHVVDPSTVRINLSQPFSPLLAQLADRAGMMVSPKAAQATGDKFGANPVCSGPFKFVERVAQDRIVLEETAAAVPSLRLTGAPIAFGENLSFRVPTSVPVTWEA